LTFLDTINLKNCKENFYQNKIKGKDLLSLTEKELRDDLKMKMGDRKRFINYRKFVASMDESSGKDEKMKKKSKQSPESYKFRSATSMKKVLRNVKNYALYEESIQ
jgi:DNA polymerase III delta prime subunit